jgi:DNA-binding NarL/FixJ family response regulator
LTREGINAILSGIIDINVVGNAGAVIELEQMISRHQPQVLIIDYNYNNRFTIRDIKYIKARFDSIRILVLSNRQNRNKVVEVIDLGIKNYVFKECSREELVNAIYTTAKGEQFFCKNTFETLFGNKLLPERDDPASALSLRETEIIQLISAGMANKEIAEKLFLSIHTVKTHRKNIIKKLGFTFKNAADLVQYTARYEK